MRVAGTEQSSQTSKYLIILFWASYDVSVVMVLHISLYHTTKLSFLDQLELEKAHLATASQQTTKEDLWWDSKNTSRSTTMRVAGTKQSSHTGNGRSGAPSVHAQSPASHAWSSRDWSRGRERASRHKTEDNPAKGCPLRRKLVPGIFRTV